MAIEKKDYFSWGLALLFFVLSIFLSHRDRVDKTEIYNNYQYIHNQFEQNNITLPNDIKKRFDEIGTISSDTAIIPNR